MTVAGCVALVIDTSYLTELYKVPGRSDKKHTKPIQSRFDLAVDRQHSRFVPFPVIFEVANHIAHVENGAARRKLADRFVQDVEEGVKDASLWTITPAASNQALLQLNELLSLCEKYRNEFVSRSIGLTDTAVISEAVRLKKKYGSGYRVHIWTLDQELKANEPDTEPGGYVSKSD